MGSEFSYEDVANNNYKKYSYSGDATEVACGAHKCYKAERVPKDEDSGYSKQVTYIDTENFTVRKIEYYDRKSEHLKTAIFGDFAEKDGVWRITTIEMSNHQNGKKTVLEWVADEIKVGLEEKDFRQGVLSR